MKKKIHIWQAGNRTFCGVELPADKSIRTDGYKRATCSKCRKVFEKKADEQEASENLAEECGLASVFISLRP